MFRLKQFSLAVNLNLFVLICLLLQAFDKQGFHAGTPPPFNLQMAPGQLATGTQAGPLGTPTGHYGTPFVPVMPHQPHSQMLHPLQVSQFFHS